MLRNFCTKNYISLATSFGVVPYSSSKVSSSIIIQFWWEKKGEVDTCAAPDGTAMTAVYTLLSGFKNMHFTCAVDRSCYRRKCTAA